ncbi:MAG TPA: cysteate synthase [Candidatus Sulfotelmatobacter sp.]|nr:cysteate synthase [Candidatus Sulfotelmatobacter sp.]
MTTGRDYQLRCCACAAAIEDDGVVLDCPHAHGPALLRTVYQRAFAVDDVPSLLRYGRWLPRGRALATFARSTVYQSTGLAAHLGLANLWIAFSGWWPQRGATLETTTFKELEAYAVLGRLARDEQRTLVISSAGNTAAAFARAATELDAPVLIVIPGDAWERLAALVRIGPSVRVVAVDGGQYEDAIALARGLAEEDGYVLEGGVRNVGRRDGMGTAMLEAVEAMGTLPDAYFQGVGSGAGALAAHEAALRLIADGRFGTRLPRLMLSQNAPFTPIHDAWVGRSATLDERSPLVAREQVRRIAASVLSNVAPPYATIGGVRDALAESGGTTYAIANAEVRAAMRMFEDLEGMDVEPAAGVTLASLVRAVRAGEIGPRERILVHVTGGGARRREPVRVEQRPTYVVARDTQGAFPALTELLSA